MVSFKFHIVAHKDMAYREKKFYLLICSLKLNTHTPKFVVGQGFVFYRFITQCVHSKIAFIIGLPRLRGHWVGGVA